MATTNTISPTRRLTRSQADRIRQLYPKQSQRALAAKFGVARSTIYAIVHRHTYDDGPIAQPRARRRRVTR